jgi:hypothetical protein
MIKSSFIGSSFIAAAVALIGMTASTRPAQGASAGPELQEAPHGKCSFDSDCHGRGKCKGGQCGACGFDSDCNIGKCKGGQCGACSFDSDCKGGKCKSGSCSNY